MCEQQANPFMGRMLYHARAIECKVDGMLNTRIQQYVWENNSKHCHVWNCPEFEFSFSPRDNNFGIFEQLSAALNTFPSFSWLRPKFSSISKNKSHSRQHRIARNRQGKKMNGPGSIEIASSEKKDLLPIVYQYKQYGWKEAARIFIAVAAEFLSGWHFPI